MKPLIKKLVVGFLLTMSLLKASGQTAEETRPEVGEFRNLLAPVSSISASFRQQLFSTDDYLLQDSQGRMHVAKPGKMRWLVDSPFEQWLISDGTTVWLFDPELEQVIIRTFDPDIAATPALLLTGSLNDLSDTYEVSLKKSDDFRSFVLTPRDSQTAYEQLIFEFKGDKITGIVIGDALGQSTKISFSDVVLNADIDPDLFSFDPPPGTMVIRDNP